MTGLGRPRDRSSRLDDVLSPRFPEARQIGCLYKEMISAPRSSPTVYIASIAPDTRPDQSS